MKKNPNTGKVHRRNVRWWILIIIIVILIAARMLMPFIVLNYVNNTLSEMKGYKGHVDDIDLRPIRGAYVIKRINIYETDNELTKTDSLPFFSAVKINISVDWKSLLKKRLVGEVKMYNPVLNFKHKKSDKSDIKSDTADFSHLIRKLVPLTINTLEISNGELHYIDRYTSPKIDIVMDSIRSTSTNLTNVTNKDTILPAKITGTGNIYGGNFTVNVNLNLLNKYPTFDLNAEMKNLDLTRVNNFLRAYANFDVDKGVFNVYTEFAAKNGRFKGYVKPLIKDLDVVQWNKEEGSVPQIMWETFISVVTATLTNQKKEQFATKVNIEGDFADTKIGIMSAIKYILINAYIEALKPKLDNTISIKNAIRENDKTHSRKRLFRKKEK